MWQFRKRAQISSKNLINILITNIFLHSFNRSTVISLTYYITVHEITACHRSLSGTISCVTDRIRFLPDTMTDRFSNFSSISYTEDRHKLRVTGTKCRLMDTMSGTGEIFISGTALKSNSIKSCKDISRKKNFPRRKCPGFCSFLAQNNKLLS